MFTDFEIATINFVLRAYYRLHFSYYSATWQLINLELSPTQTQKLIAYVDNGGVPPFSKSDIEKILSNGKPNHF